MFHVLYFGLPRLTLRIQGETEGFNWNGVMYKGQRDFFGWDSATLTSELRANEQTPDTMMASKSKSTNGRYSTKKEKPKQKNRSLQVALSLV